MPTTVQLLDAADAFSAAPTVRNTVVLADSPATVGRHVVGIDDKRVSRAQLRLRAEDTRLFATRLGPAASFVQSSAADAPVELPKDEEHPLQPHAIVWLSKDPKTGAFAHPLRFIASPPIAPAPPLPASAAAEDARPAEPSAAVWQVWLNRSFQPYESPLVQRSLEEAFQRGEAQLEVEVRGQAYVVEFHPQCRQVLKGDPSKTRAVRRYDAAAGGHEATPAHTTAPPTTLLTAPSSAATSLTAPSSAATSLIAPSSAANATSLTAPSAASNAAPSQPSSAAALPSASPTSNASLLSAPALATPPAPTSAPAKKRSLAEMARDAEAAIEARFAARAIDATSHATAPHTSPAPASLPHASPPHASPAPASLPHAIQSHTSPPLASSPRTSPPLASPPHASPTPASLSHALPPIDCPSHTSPTPASLSHTSPPPSSPPLAPSPAPPLRAPPSPPAIPPAAAAAPLSSAAATRTLAFPLLSGAADCQFDAAIAARVGAREASRFLSRRPHAPLRLLLVDATPSLVQAFEASLKDEGLLGDPRVLALHGDLPRLASSTGGAHIAQVVANTANTKLNAKGGGLNKSLHALAGPVRRRGEVGSGERRVYIEARAVPQALEQATRAKWPPCAKPGFAYPVLLPAACALREEGFEWVIHVNCPTMNPNRPLCLEGDYERGAAQLSATYEALFEAFAQLP